MYFFEKEQEYRIVLPNETIEGKELSRAAFKRLRNN